MERVMGIEPTLAAWEAAVLPLNYTRTVKQRQSQKVASDETFFIADHNLCQPVFANKLKDSSDSNYYSSHLYFIEDFKYCRSGQGNTAGAGEIG
jgi:hypothetical protein